MDLLSKKFMSFSKRCGLIYLHLNSYGYFEILGEYYLSIRFPALLSLVYDRRVRGTH